MVGHTLEFCIPILSTVPLECPRPSQSSRDLLAHPLSTIQVRTRLTTRGINENVRSYRYSIPQWYFIPTKKVAICCTSNALEFSVLREIACPHLTVTTRLTTPLLSFFPLSLLPSALPPIPLVILSLFPLNYL